MRCYRTSQGRRRRTPKGVQLNYSAAVYKHCTPASAHVLRGTDRMQRITTFAIVMILASIGPTQTSNLRNSSQPLSSTTAISKTSDDKSSRVDALLARWSRDDMPGAAVIVIQDGKVVHQNSYGLADVRAKERISSKTVFDIASLSKQFTAMAVMILVERGKLNYEDSISKFFPEFESDARQVTIRQLLNQTSGIADYTLVWGESKKLKGDSARTNQNVVRFLARQQKLRFQPGQKWEYSNSNYVLLAQIVSKVTGEPFTQFVKENIFQPLAMNDSFVYDNSKATQAGRATGYISQGSGAKPADRNLENYVCGDGQINSTTEDLAKWDQALYTEKLVKASTLNEAFRSGRLSDGTSINYGFGWGLGRYRGLPVISHGGDTDGFVAQITRFPQQHFTVILLSNYEQFTAPFAIANKIADIYLANDFKSPAPVQLPLERLRDYVGRYALYDYELRISLAGNALWLTSSGQDKIKLVPVSDEEFLISVSAGASSIGFNKNSQGQVTSLTLLDQNGITLWKQ